MGYEFKQDDVFKFADSKNYEYRQKKDELFFKQCPYCNGGEHRDKESCSINLRTGAYKCFRSGCNKHGHFVEMARDFNYRLTDLEVKQYRKLPQKPIEVKSKAIEYMAGRHIGEDIVKKYHITTTTKSDDILVFPFYNDQNEMEFIKYRNTKYNGKGNKEWCEKDTKPILFGMGQCVGFDRLIITEGQIDSLSVAECGFDNAVSVPTGATGFTWYPNCFDWISKFKEVIIFGDYEHGKMTLLADLQKRLTCKLRSVRFCDYLGEKDANAILCKYGKDAIITAIENAETPKISNVKDLSTVKSVDINSLAKIKTNIRDLDKKIGGLIMGQVILLTGKRGDGKSTFMSQLICEALEQNESAFIYSGELADYHFKRWLDYQLAGPNNVVESTNDYGDKIYSISSDTTESINAWYKGRAYIYDNNYINQADGEFEALTQTIEKVIKQYGVKLVCIDNLMTAMDVSINDDLYRAQSKFVGDLKKIAINYDVAVVLVAHPRKSKDANFDNDDVSGSGDITNKVDIILNYKQTQADDHDSLLEITKDRLFGKRATGDNAIKLCYSESTKRIIATSGITRKYGWEKLKQQNDDTLPFEV